MRIMSRPSGDGPDIVEVARWCQDCGAIVIDVDIDGQTKPGDAMTMTFPTLARRMKTEGGAS
jgi:hypothetical protein